MDRLTGLDGAFLSLESPTTHLHILGALIFDPSEVKGGVDFWQIRQMVAERLPLVPPFRKRVVEVPFGVQHPAMVDDPDFDLDYHVRRVSLPSPGGIEELEVLLGDLASRPLDRTRPLWEFHVVEGVEDGRLALVPKVHHSIIDGVSGAEVIAAFFDLTPTPAPRPLFGRTRGSRRWDRPRGDGRSPQSVPSRRSVQDPAWSPDPLPGGGEQWRSILGSLPGHADSVIRTVSRTLAGARSLTGRQLDGNPPPYPFEAPRTSINRAISAHRRVAFAELPLNEIHRVREVLGGTTNDVVLAIVAGAMRTFFDRREEHLGKPLVAMVPVSVRTESEQGELGNRLSAMMVPLADVMAEPAERLRLISERTRSAKERRSGPGTDVFAGWAQALAPAIATRLTRLVSNVRLFDHLTPMFNLIVSNVPGPDFPLYFAGARMVAMYPVGPIIEGVGINVTVFSYLDTLYVGIQGCWELVPDIDTIVHGIHGSMEELTREVNRKVRPVPWWHGELPA